MEQTKNQPEKRFSTGAITATVWQNQGRGRNNEVVGYHTVSIQRSYKDKNGVWQKANSMRINDLPRATLVLQKAFEYLVVKEAQQGRSSDDYVMEAEIEEVV